MISKSLSSNDHTGDVDTLKDEYAHILRTFLRDISFKIPSYQYDLTIEDYAERHFVSKGFSTEFIQRVRPIFKWSAGMAIATYPFVPVSVQRVIAVYTVYIIIVDDLASELKDDLKSFGRRLYSGQPQTNKLLQCLAEYMDVVCDSYGQFTRDMIMKSTTEYISACYLEVEQDGQLNFPPDAPEFPNYLRLKTGVTETYAFLAFPSNLYPEESHLKLFLPAIPDLLYFINFFNDIFSFYKESVVGNEQINFICNYARANGMTPLQSLQHVCTVATQAVRRIRATLSPDPRLQGDVEQMFHGYSLYYLSQSRYRLTELDIPEAAEARSLLKGQIHAEISQNQVSFEAESTKLAVDISEFEKKRPIWNGARELISSRKSWMFRKRSTRA